LKVDVHVQPPHDPARDRFEAGPLHTVVVGVAPARPASDEAPLAVLDFQDDPDVLSLPAVAELEEVADFRPGAGRRVRNPPDLGVERETAQRDRARPAAATSQKDKPKPEDVARRVLFERTNELRAGEKAPPLKADARLEKVAQALAAALAKDDKLGGALDKLARDLTAKEGYPGQVAVNHSVAFSGASAPAEVVVAGASWAVDEGQRRRAVDAARRDTGVGVVVATGTPGRWHFVQVFGTPAK
jgi:uncharacterized protein YkwD